MRNGLPEQSPRALDNYSVLHPEIRTYRKEGEPFVVIRIYTARE